MKKYKIQGDFLVSFETTINANSEKDIDDNLEDLLLSDVQICSYDIDDYDFFEII